MFGYIRTDEPYLYKKDEVLYGAMYCGLCKAIGKTCGQSARVGLTYDVAFLSVLLHNILGVDVKISKERCIAHPVKKRKIASVDELTETLACINTVLCYYKAVDDVVDDGKGRVKKSLFKKGFRRALAKCPAVNELVKKCYDTLSEYERNSIASPDMVADPFAVLTRDLSRLVLKESSTEHTDKLFYYLGKWIYLIDALDDFDKDKKKSSYNVFACSYPNIASGKELVDEYKQEIFPLFNSTFWNLKQGFECVEFFFNKDLIENVLIRGIPKKTDEVVKKYLTSHSGEICQ